MDNADFVSSVRAELAETFARGPHPDSPLFRSLMKREIHNRSEAEERELEDWANCPRGERRPAMPTSY